MYFYIVKLIYIRTYCFLKNFHVFKLTLFLLINYNFFYCINFPNLTDNPTLNLEPPSNFIVTGNNTSAELKWSTSENAIGYNIYRFEDSQNNFQNSTLIASSIKDGNYTDNNLLNGTLYFYNLTVLALLQNSIVESPKTNTVSLLTIPEAPTTFVSSINRSNIYLNWSQTKGTSLYKIYRSFSTTRQLEPLYTTTNNFYLDTYMYGGVTLYYNIASNNASGDSIKVSSLQSVITISDAPTNFNINILETTATLNWDSVTGATKYKIYRSTTTGFIPSDTNLIYTFTVTSQTIAHYNYIDTGLLNGTTYYYLITTVNLLGESLPTQEKSILTIPSNVSNLRAIVSRNNISLSWDSVIGATSYKLLKSLNNIINKNSAPLLTTSNLIGNDSNVMPNTSYFYTVLSSNATGDSILTSATIKAISFPDTPANLSLTATNNSVNVSWNNPINNATSYNVYRSTSTPVLTLASNKINNTSIISSPYVDNTPLNGLTYNYVVTSVNATGESLPTTTQTINIIPNAPTLFLSSAVGNTVNITWMSVVGATYYNILRGENSTTLSNIGSPINASFTDTNLNWGSIYNYKVTAVNSGGTSATSNNIIVEIPPAPPSNLKLTSSYQNGTNTGLNFIWDQVTSLPTYNICKTDNANEPLSSCVWLTTGSTSNVRIGYSLASTGNFAYFRIVSVSNSGIVSTPSNEIQVLLLPPAPVLSSNGTNTLNWTVSNSATSYRIFRSSNSSAVSVQIASVTGGAIQDNNFIDTIFPKNVNDVFYYVVSATNSSGNSVISNLITFNFTKLALSPTLIWTSTTGGNYNLNITGTTASSNTWTLSSSTFATTWTSLSRTSGSGNINVNLNVFVNDTIFPHKAIYTLMSNFGEIQILTINQLPLAIIPSSGTNIVPEGITRIWVTIYGGDGGSGANGGTIDNTCGIGVNATNGQSGSRGQGRSCELIVSENSTFSWHIGSLGGDGSNGDANGTGGTGGTGGMQLGANGVNGSTKVNYGCFGIASRGGGGGGGGGGGASYIDYNGQIFYISGGNGGSGGNGSSKDSDTSDVANGGAGGNGGTGTSNLNCINMNNLPARTGAFSAGSISVFY